MKVLEVMGCRSSVVRALVAKARGPMFDSLATTTKVTFNLVFYEGSKSKGQNLIINNNNNIIIKFLTFV